MFNIWFDIGFAKARFFVAYFYRAQEVLAFFQFSGWTTGKDKYADSQAKNELYIFFIWAQIVVNLYPAICIFSTLTNIHNELSRMLTKAKINYLQQLHTKKGRRETGLFIAEGPKMAEELMASGIEVVEIYCDAGLSFSVNNNKVMDFIAVEKNELKKISGLVTPNEVLVVARIPEHTLHVEELKNKLTLLLDDIQDPGNMGTIIRVADWFGIENIVCSSNTVDCYNSKVIQATMGSIARVKVHYADLEKVIGEGRAQGLKIYGAALDGETIYEGNLSQESFVVIGNESKGISQQVLKLLNHKIKIPHYAHFKSVAAEPESLNAAVAAALVVAEFRRSASQK